jgi:peptide/nickel transport system permease protein
MSLAEAEVRQLQVEGADDAVTLWSDAWQRLKRNPSAIVGIVLIVIFILVGVLAPWLAPEPPNLPRLERITPGNFPGPSADHWFGVDQLGRDELTRVLYGARYSLVIGVVSVAIGATVGMLIGAVAGSLGGWVDNVLMRLMDMMLAIPGLLFAIAVAAALGRSLTSVMIAIGVVNIPPIARLLRGAMLAERERDYVLALRSVGVKRRRITLNHMLPNATAPVIVQATLALATAIIDAAGLAFLGLGAQDPGIPEWGRMLAETQSFLQHAPHLALFPGAAIVLSVLGFNLLGDGLREALDPKLRR